VVTLFDVSGSLLSFFKSFDGLRVDSRIGEHSWYARIWNGLYLGPSGIWLYP
jgi:hypothetical protein